MGEFHTREEKEAQVSLAKCQRTLIQNKGDESLSGLSQYVRKHLSKMGERASWIINLEGDFPIKINESLSLKGN